MVKKAKTPYAILGLLTLCPMSGYDLKQFYDRSLRFFWNESFGQIYPALKSLEAEGLVEGHSEPGERGGQRRVFAITAAGREMLHQWLAEPPEDAPARNELLLKLFFVQQEDIPSARKHLEAVKAQAEEKLAIFKVIKTSIPEENPDRVSSTLHLFTVDYGCRAEQMTLEWTTDCLAKLEALEREVETEPTQDD